jgi:hypothetical protein
MEPAVQYAKTNDGVNIAYYSIGDGAPTLIYLTPGSHLAREWEYPEQRSWLERLAKNYRLIRLTVAVRDSPLETSSSILA